MNTDYNFQVSSKSLYGFLIHAGRNLAIPITMAIGFYNSLYCRNNLGRVVHTYVLLSLSSIAWYQPKGGDALRLGSLIK